MRRVSVPMRSSTGNCQNDRAGPHERRFEGTSSKAPFFGRHNLRRYTFPAYTCLKYAWLVFWNSVGKDDFPDAQEELYPIDSLVGTRLLVNIPQRARLAERNARAPSLDFAVDGSADRLWDEARLVFPQIFVLPGEQLPQP